MENIIIALIAIAPTILTLIVGIFKDKKTSSWDALKKELLQSIEDVKKTMESNDNSILDSIEYNNKESLKRYLVFMLSRAKFEEGFSFNEFEKSIVEESYKIYRSELGNGYVEELYLDCKRIGKL
jgi:hypothetical protein